MPRGDRTGPAGMGPMTGRGLGFCSGFRTPGYFSSLFGKGLGYGRGRGYGRLFWIGGLLPGCAYLAYRWVNRRK